jgi:hypothetical protein
MNTVSTIASDVSTTSFSASLIGTASKSVLLAYVNGHPLTITPVDNSASMRELRILAHELRTATSTESDAPAAPRKARNTRKVKGLTPTAPVETAPAASTEIVVTSAPATTSDVLPVETIIIPDAAPAVNPAPVTGYAPVGALAVGNIYGIADGNGAQTRYTSDVTVGGRYTRPAGFPVRYQLDRIEAGFAYLHRHNSVVNSSGAKVSVERARESVRVPVGAVIAAPPH